MPPHNMDRTKFKAVRGWVTEHNNCHITVVVKYKSLKCIFRRHKKKKDKVPHFNHFQDTYILKSGQQIVRWCGHIPPSQVEDTTIVHWVGVGSSQLSLVFV